MACTDIDNNNQQYQIDCEEDFNSYDTDDLQDITRSAMGDSAREVAKGASFYTFVWIMVAIATLAVAIIGFAKLRNK